MKTLRRRVIIRESDFNKMNVKATKNNLYDSAEFLPITKDDLEKLKVIKILKNQEVSINLNSINNPVLALYDNKHLLYDQRYFNWTVYYDAFGYMWVQSKSNRPSNRIGWGIFEKSY